jgi:uncharacterized membrane protein
MIFLISAFWIVSLVLIIGSVVLLVKHARESGQFTDKNSLASDMLRRRYPIVEPPEEHDLDEEQAQSEQRKSG